MYIARFVYKRVRVCKGIHMGVRVFLCVCVCLSVYDTTCRCGDAQVCFCDVCLFASVCLFFVLEHC